MSPKTITAPTTLYEQDYSLWLENIVQQLRHCAQITTTDHSLTGMDLDNLIEELESMGRSEKRAVYSNLKVLLIHLLKYRYQPDRRTKSWRATIREHRQRLQEAFNDSPSLSSYYNEVFDRCYQAARELAAEETGLSVHSFPFASPFSEIEILSFDYLPD